MPWQEVTEEDAEDVVQLLHESLLDAFTTDTGEVDFGRKGGISLAKQVQCVCYLFTGHVAISPYFCRCIAERLI